MQCRQDLLLIQARNKHIENDLLAELNSEIIDVEENGGVVYTTGRNDSSEDVLENRDDVDSHGKDSIYTSKEQEDCE